MNAEGWYVITRAQLLAAGFDLGGDTRMLQLFAEGVEQPIAIIEKRSGPFIAADSIEFYGTGIDTPFSGTRVYWLSPRIAVRKADSGIECAGFGRVGSGELLVVGYFGAADYLFCGFAEWSECR